MKKLFPATNMIEEAKRQSKGHFFLLEMLIFVLVFLVTTVLSSIPSLIYEVANIFNSPELLDTITQYNQGKITYDEYYEAFVKLETNPASMVISLLGTTLSLIATIIFCRYIEKRKVSTMGFRKKGAVPEYLVGMAIGTVMYTVSVGIAYAAGGISYDGVVSDIKWGLIGIYFIGFLIQGMSEEVTCRGYFMVSLSRRSHIALAVAISSITFGCMHLANPGVSPLAIVNITLFGIFEGLYIIRRGNIWGAGAIHSLWNFVQGNFYGISVSGALNMDSVLKFSNVPSKDLWNGGEFGLEAGLAVTIVTLIGITVLMFIPTNKNEIFDEAAAPVIESPLTESDVEISDTIE